MSIQAIRPNGDERIQHKTAVLNGFTYHYLYAVPISGKWTDTVFLVCIPSQKQRLAYWTSGVIQIYTRRHSHCRLSSHQKTFALQQLLANALQIHGWPDLSMGWRYQIPLLVNLGFRVVAPDMMGYGGTVSTHSSPPSSTIFDMENDTELSIQ